jgi:hypothetical protein
MKRNFKKMSDEELVALQETADEQTLAAIEAELESRATAAAEQVSVEEQTADPSEDAEAETADGAEQDKAAELEELLAECQKNVGHRCKLVPVGTIEWEEGTVVGCVKIKRSNTVAYAVKLDNGKRVVKNYKAPLFEILDEVVERAKVTRHAGSRTKAELWSEERMTEEVNKYIHNVGRAIVLKGATEEENVTGQITGIVPVKRSNSVLYRVAVPAPTEEDPEAVAIVHKSVANIAAYDIMAATEESEAFNANYMARRENMANRTPLTGAELVLDLELKLEKAKEAVKKAEERVATLEKAIAEKKAQLEATAAEPTAETTSEEENML